MNKEEVAEKSKAASDVFLSSELYKSANTLMIYMPLGNEVDTKDIIKAAFADNKTVLVPVTDRSGKITPYIITPDTSFKKGAFSVMEPCEAQKADNLAIDLALVPGIAFDKWGGRVGFGKGCYDKFLGGITTVKVGFCYSFQICGNIPTDEFDVKMDCIITEKGLL